MNGGRAATDSRVHEGIIEGVTRGLVVKDGAVEHEVEGLVISAMAYESVDGMLYMLDGIMLPGGTAMLVVLGPLFLYECVPEGKSRGRQSVVLEPC